MAAGRALKKKPRSCKLSGPKFCLRSKTELQQESSSPLSRVSQWEANEKRGSKKRERGMGRSMMVIDQFGRSTGNK